jgi:hypothetical protein
MEEKHTIPLLDGNFTARCPGPMHLLFAVGNVKVIIVDEVTKKVFNKGVIINKVPHTTRVYENSPGFPFAVKPPIYLLSHEVPSRDEYTEAELDVFVDQMRNKIDARLQEEIANFEATALQAICR